MYWPSVSLLKQNRNKIVATSIDIYMHSIILILQMQNNPNDLFYSPIDRYQPFCPANKYHMLSNYCSCQQLTPNDTHTHIYIHT